MNRSQGKVSTEVSGLKGRYAKTSEKITVFMLYFCQPDVFPGERLRCEPGSIFPGQFNIRAWVKIKEFKAAKKTEGNGPGQTAAILS